MTAFCPTCPNRGECEGPINAIVEVARYTDGNISSDGSRAYLSFESGIPQGPTSITFQYQNAEGRSSKPITVRRDSYEGAEQAVNGYAARIEECDGPRTTKKFLGLISTRQCEA